MKNIKRYSYKGIVLLTFIISTSFRISKINDPKIAIPDINFEKALIKGGYDENTEPDGFIPLSKLEAIIRLDVSSSEITSLKGIEYCINLVHLSCWNNQINELNTSQNKKLAILECYSNNLISIIGLNENLELRELRCSRNQLTHLDLGNNFKLSLSASHF